MHPQLRPDLERILRKLGTDDIVERMCERISWSELNTLLLNVFQEKAKKSSAGDLMQRYRDNRFVHPAKADVIRLKQLELEVLQIAEQHSAEAVQLSPVAPLGSCSVIAPADQNKTISALRGVEVVSDATNVMALHICNMIKTNEKNNRNDFIRLSTTHRHVRAQWFGNAPGMLPHFHLFCMVTSGVDQGSYSFEKQSLWEHIAVYRDIFHTLYGSEIEILLSGRDGYKDGEGLLERIVEFGKSPFSDIKISRVDPKRDNPYYQGLQFTIKTHIRGKDHHIGDGGFVDWPQQLLGSKKERMLISAIGLDRLMDVT